MTITIYENAELGFQVVKMNGALTDRELADLGDLHLQNREWAKADAVHLLDQDVDVSGLTYAQLDALREHYRALQRQLDLLLLRRSAWVCPNPSAWRFVEYWLAGRHSRDGQGTDVCLVADLDGAALLFEKHELEAIAAWKGFAELQRLERPNN